MKIFFVILFLFLAGCYSSGEGSIKVYIPFLDFYEYEYEYETEILFEAESDIHLIEEYYSLHIPSFSAIPQISQFIQTPVLLLQTDNLWGHLRFAGFYVRDGGCGPVTLAMVASTLRGVDVLPCYVVPLVRRWGVYGIGSSFGLFDAPSLMDHFGLEVDIVSVRSQADRDYIMDAVRDGAVFIANVVGPNTEAARVGNRGTIAPHSRGGHFVMVHTVLDNGNLLMYSPRWATTNSNTDGWTFEELISEMSINRNTVWLYRSNLEIVFDKDFCCGLR